MVSPKQIPSEKINTKEAPQSLSGTERIFVSIDGLEVKSPIFGDGNIRKLYEYSDYYIVFSMIAGLDCITELIYFIDKNGNVLESLTFDSSDFLAFIQIEKIVDNTFIMSVEDDRDKKAERWEIVLTVFPEKIRLKNFRSNIIFTLFNRFGISNSKWTPFQKSLYDVKIIRNKL